MNLQEDRVFINASAIIKISILMRAYDLPLYMAKLYINFSYVKHAFMIFQPPPVVGEFRGGAGQNLRKEK